MDYQLAAWVGRAWRAASPGFGDARTCENCGRIARGEQLPAIELFQAQDFTVKILWRAGMVLLLTLFPVAGVGAILQPGVVNRPGSPGGLVGYATSGMVTAVVACR